MTSYFNDNTTAVQQFRSCRTLLTWDSVQYFNCCHYVLRISYRIVSYQWYHISMKSLQQQFRSCRTLPISHSGELTDCLLRTQQLPLRPCDNFSNLTAVERVQREVKPFRRKTPLCTIAAPVMRYNRQIRNNVCVILSVDKVKRTNTRSQPHLRFTKVQIQSVVYTALYDSCFVYTRIYVIPLPLYNTKYIFLYGVQQYTYTLMNNSSMTAVLARVEERCRAKYYNITRSQRDPLVLSGDGTAVRDTAGCLSQIIKSETQQS